MAGRKLFENTPGEHLTDSQMREWEKHIENFADSILNTIEAINQSSKSSLYSPQTGEYYLQEVNNRPIKPTHENLVAWLSNPAKFQKELRQTSEYLSAQIMQYKRTIDHFAKILSFKHYVSCSTPIEKTDISAFKKGYQKCLDYLSKFNLKYKKDMIMIKTIEEGGYFAYFIEDDHFVNMIEIPSDYAYITGRWQNGFTYAIDLSWFDRLVNMENVVPELYEYYKIFVKMREANLKGDQLFQYQYYPVPVTDGAYFSFDPLVAQAVPPFCGVFKDALEIDTYKALLKQKSALDTWKIIAQEMPLDANNQSAMSADMAKVFVRIVQSVLPKGTSTFATPLKVRELNFSNGQNQNNITGLGEELFWRSVGVNGSLMDLGDKSAASLKYSLINDASFVEHMYRQFENYINLQFALKSRKYTFSIKLFGNIYTDADDMKAYANLVSTNNMPVLKLFAMAGFEPQEVEPTVDMENLLGLKEKMTPIISGYQQPSGGEAGAKEKDESELTDSGENQRDYDSNKNSGKTDV